MKSLYLSMLALFLSMLAFTQTDTATLKKLNSDWLNAYPKKDTATLSKILADDFILINPGGIKQTKKDNLENMLNQHIETTSVSIENVEIRIINPTTGLLTAWTSFTFK